LGLSVVQVNIESIHPPVEVADIYQRVVSASVDKNTIITNALANAERILVEAERQSMVAVNNALAEQFNRTSSAQKEMAVYYAAMEAYEVNPRSFRLTKYLNTFETTISGNRVFVFSPGTESSIPNTFIGRSNIVNVWNQQVREINE
jgi:regulator of protease activity HflC (stomatin/prohibitin superfamily)